MAAPAREYVACGAACSPGPGAPRAPSAGRNGWTPEARQRCGAARELQLEPRFAQPSRAASRSRRADGGHFGVHGRWGVWHDVSPEHGPAWLCRGTFATFFKSRLYGLLAGRASQKLFGPPAPTVYWARRSLSSGSVFSAAHVRRSQSAARSVDHTYSLGSVG